jgi:peptide/nickel transport system substrate-binding protein
MPKYTGGILDGTAPEPIIYLAQHWAAGGSGGSANRAAYSNPKFDAVLEKIMLELDADKRTELLREAGMILLEDNPAITLAQQVNRTYWWPWIRNYYGESSVTDDAAWSPLVMTMWIDEAKKKSMGY